MRTRYPSEREIGTYVSDILDRELGYILPLVEVLMQVA
jgi:hypothetical protein